MYFCHYCVQVAIYQSNSSYMKEEVWDAGDYDIKVEFNEGRGVELKAQVYQQYHQYALELITTIRGGENRRELHPWVIETSH